MNRLFSQMLNGVTCGDCIDVMAHMPSRSVDFVLTDPPYLVRYHDRSGRRVINDDNDAWLKPAFAQIHRLLKPDSLCVSFYGWNKTDVFMTAWREAGAPVLHPRASLSASQGLPTVPGTAAARCHRLALFRQPPPSDAETRKIP
jgi:DNA modification methylase